MAKLTEKQKRFVDEYLIDLNATRAYKAAYPNVKNDEVAASAAVRLLRNVKVQKYLSERQIDLQRRTEITQDKVILELAKVAFANGSDFAKVVTRPRKELYFDKETETYQEREVDMQYVELVDTDTLPADKKAAISTIKETKFGIAVESCDKLKALELIGRHLGMFKDKMEVSGDMTVNNPYEGLTKEQLLKIAGVPDVGR